MRYWFRTVRDAIDRCFGEDSSFVILEVGVYEAMNARQLLEAYPEARVVSVDPVRPPLVDVLEERYGPRFIFLEDLSLNVLKDLGRLDVVLLDGDHNRYTVYNELKTLYENQERFPLVILHDIDYPWGRVDFSYNQTTIPTGEFGGERQGVLTGVEDFIEEFKSPVNEYYFKLTLNYLPPGLGILEWIEGENI